VPYATKKTIAAWRHEIVQARIKLANDNLPGARIRELWTIVDCREACLKLGGADFEAEMELVDREIERQSLLLFVAPATPPLNSRSDDATPRH
jgi:hypothetical protein